MKNFPSGFIWGTATAAHQVEGNNTKSDWWKWENRKDYNLKEQSKENKYPLEPSLDGCGSYNRYEEDFDLCVDMNNGGVRFSIEWARIEPEKGVYDQKEIEHYRKVLLSAKKRGLKTFITVHHFTSPLWLSNEGGWLNPKVSTYFSKYAKKCAEEFGDLIDVFLTINEPQVYVLKSYTDGTWPPAKNNILLGVIVQMNMLLAHRRAYRSIKKVKDEYKVGIVKNIVWYESVGNTFLLKYFDLFVTKVLYWANCDFVFTMLKGTIDVIGVNYYFTNRIHNLKTANTNDVVTDLGWWVHPEGLKNVLLSLKKYNLPIYITENGLADKDDHLRKKFIYDMLNSCYEALSDGVLLKGYFYWSLLDNYEWHEGYWPRFGLIEIDRDNGLKRKPRSSAVFYAKVCKDNGI